MAFAEQLAQFAVDARRHRPPAAALQAARLRLLDGLGVALAALGCASVPQLRSSFALFGENGRSSAIGHALGQPAAAAALHNGLLMHGLEFDDTHLGAVVHGAPVVLPSVLAVAERDGRSGEELLSAICVGWEVLARIGATLRGALQPHGFQATSVAGPLASAAAVAHLTGLDAGRTVHALGIAGSQSSGVFEFLSSGATSKVLHGGWASLAGMVAAGLAADGMTGPATILEGRHGLFSAYARRADLGEAMAAQLAGLGKSWAVTEARPKAAPCCHYIQAFLEALQAVLDQGVRPEQIQGIQCLVDPRQAQLVCEPWEDKLRPATGYAAKWSLPYCLAALALRGEVQVNQFEGAPDAELLAWARRIEWQPKEDGFPDRYAGHVIVTLADGGQRDSHVPDVLGGSGRPFPEALLQEKFLKAARLALPEEAARSAMAAILGVGEENSLSRLGAALRAARAIPGHSGATQGREAA